MWPFFRRRASANASASSSRNLLNPNSTPDLPQGFGYKSTWWAISTTDPYAVAKSINLSDARPCNWETGIAASYGNGIFISPPIDGWVFVTGCRLPPNGKEAASNCLTFLLRLSLEFNDAQAFCTNRVVDYHVWARAINGELYRGFEYLGESGEILWDVGDDSTEKQLGLNFPRTEDLTSTSANPDDFDYPEEDHVMKISRRWSISPIELDGKKTLGVGLIGFNVKP